MNKELQSQMKERFDSVIGDMMTAGFFLEQAVEILERCMIERSLHLTNTNQSEAAKLLGIHRNTLQRKMLEHKIDGRRPRRKPMARAAGKTKTVRRRRQAS
jgi:DNA-binding NtrC family response regulator